MYNSPGLNKCFDLAVPRHVIDAVWRYGLRDGGILGLAGRESKIFDRVRCAYRVQHCETGPFIVRLLRMVRALPFALQFVNSVIYLGGWGLLTFWAPYSVHPWSAMGICEVGSMSCARATVLVDRPGCTVAFD